jgi:hypothetical protein
LGEWSGSGSAWAFQGVFGTRNKAIAACRDGNYFIFSAQLDGELPHESFFAPDAEYPLAENQCNPALDCARGAAGQNEAMQQEREG